VEGRGNATIQDVSTFRAPSLPIATPTNEPSKLAILNHKQELLDRDLRRLRTASRAIRNYLDYIDLRKVTPQDLLSTVDNFSEAMSKYDEQIAKVEEESRRVRKEIEEELAPKGWVGRATPPAMPKCERSVTVSIFTPTEGEVELVLVYGELTSARQLLLEKLKPNILAALRSAGWYSSYDLRVNTESKEAPLELIYKGTIQQNTGEVCREP